MNELDPPGASGELDVLRVFCDGDGRHGNALGVVRDPARHPDRASRQALAAELGFSETVFVDDPERGVVDIYTPTLRLPFAGRPLVGTAWLLDLEAVNPPAGEVWARHDGEFTWITARAAWASPWRFEQYASPAEVDAMPAPPPGEGRLCTWAWEDEAGGRVRARAFPRNGDGIVEDEATGAAALLLTDRLGRALNITQGRGSQILTAPGPDGIVEIGGRVRLATPAAAPAPGWAPASVRMSLPGGGRTRLPHAVTAPGPTS
ncbi:PhzF family phenazine biosynthesis protein [Streptomyces peucetius]|uniref:PhzF family phenazine biosynthesis protein n=1 Tax=Streptomyces peucetius TaxID=1950 RepID=A0ABY6I489_STRPE|nr:PhzF family phenazine biosynthesis protein [Streptomyces peucetius]UYQ61790.1 PhzF family phenazine biosynthesis protein [Streptomyces peucetius]